MHVLFQSWRINNWSEIVTVKIEVAEKCNKCRMQKSEQSRSKVGRVQHIEGASSGLSTKKIMGQGVDNNE